MRGAVALQKPGTVKDVAREPGILRNLHVNAEVEGVALIVVEEEIIVVLWRSEIRKTTGDAAASFGVLVRVSKVGANASEDLRRAECRLPAADAGTVDGEREED